MEKFKEGDRVSTKEDMVIDEYGWVLPGIAGGIETLRGGTLGKIVSIEDTTIGIDLEDGGGVIMVPSSQLRKILP